MSGDLEAGSDVLLAIIMQAGPSTHHRKSWLPNGQAAEAIESDYDSDESSSSEDVTEDEEGTDLTPALDAAILRTLGKIRRGEGVYGGERVLEQELEQATAEAARRGVKARTVTRAEAKPFLLADHHRTTLLEGRDLAQEEEDQAWQAPPIPYAQEQRRMRREAIEAFHGAVEEEEDGEFVPVKRESDGNEAGEKEDEGYRKFLLEMGGGEEEVRKLLGMGDAAISFVRADDEADEEGNQAAGVDQVVSKKKLEKQRKKDSEKKAKADDEFLMNFILNRGWVDKDAGDKTTRLELETDVHAVNREDDDDEVSNAAGPSHPWGQLEEDEFDDKADEFEAEYNFRFEEPGSSSIHTHPRQIDSLVRRPDDARKNKRQERAARKAAEQAAKEEEARKAKGQKRREMDGQLAALRKEVGEREWAKVEEVLEGEFEEELWERVIGGLLEKLEAGGGEGGDDDEKPTWDDEDGDVGDGQVYEGADEAHADQEVGDDGPINMDADFVGFEPSKKKRKRDKKGKNRDREEESALQEPLSVQDRAHQVKRAMEEYKALDHEDMIGDMPTRFHYTKSAPLAYGLTPAEILLASDAELNQIMSVKHIAPYRSGGLGMAGKGLNKRVRDLKESLKGRRWGEEYVPPKEGKEERYRDQGWPKRNVGGGSDGAQAVKPKKREGRNERKRKAAAAAANVDLGETKENGAVSHAGPVPIASASSQAVPSAQLKLEGGGDAAAGVGEASKKRRKKRKHGAALDTAT